MTKKPLTLAHENWGDTPAHDQRRYRTALGAFPTGVAIVTMVTEDGEKLGVTINSFTSVSLDPPLVLWCLDNRSEWRKYLVEGCFFTINILGSDDALLAERFAQPIANRFGGVATESVGKALLLKDAVTRLICKTRRISEEGDHQLIIGEVIRFDDRAKDPLVFHKGAFKRTFHSGA